MDCQLRWKHCHGQKALLITEEQISLMIRVLGGLILAFLKSILLGSVYKNHIITQCEVMQMAILGGNLEENFNAKAVWK